MKTSSIIPKALVLSIVLILILLVSGYVYAKEVHRAATLSDLTGDVSILKADGERPIKAFKNMSLTQGDRIITGRGASATLNIGNDIVLHVAENTQILISELIESATTDSESTSINLLGGGLWTRLKKALNADSKYEVKTPTAVMGARGTEFYTSHSNGTTNVSVLSGAVSVTSYKTVRDEDGSTRQIELDVVLEENQHVSLVAKPDELLDFVQEELTLEKLDLFALEILKEIAESEPELVKPEFIERIDEVIETKKEEKRQMEGQEEQEETPEPEIAYDESVQQEDSRRDRDRRDSYTPPSYTVTFDVGDGSPVNSQTVRRGSKVEEPVPPTREGHSFGGWYKDEECTEAWDFANDVVTGNMTLYAKWIPGLKPAVELILETDWNYVDSGVDIAFAPDYDWVNSITSVKVKNSNYSDEFVTLDKDIDYYIETEDDLYYLKISFTEKPYLDVPGDLIIKVEAYGYEVSLVEQKLLPRVNVFGCEFEIFIIGNDGQIDQKDMAYENTYTISISVKDEDGKPVKGYQPIAEIIIIPEETEDVLIIDGKECTAGWNKPFVVGTLTDDDGSSSFEITIPPLKDPAIETGFKMDIWAGIEPTSVLDDPITFNYYRTVTFETDGGSAVESQTVEYGKWVYEPKDPVRDGNTFAGWYTDEACTEEFDFSTPITADITLYAKWEPEEEPQP